MVEKHELRGIASLPQEVYDEITLSFASDDLEVKVRNGRLMRLRLVSVPFDRSASRILFSAVCLDTSRLCKKAQLLHVQSPSSIKFVFTSDLCRFIRYLTVCLSSEIQQWNSRTVERTYENLSRCLIRLPSLQYFEIIPTICDNAHLQVDTMLRALRRAQRYLPRLVGLKISVPEILFQEPPPRLWKLEDVLRRYLPQLQHVDIDFDTRRIYK
ncbi:hypothetical protein CBS12448_10524 [Aspergillus niger]|nr:hypothetical protein CBS12448_10524 [Aspergillus niger]KAI2942583.1 hypothetical protein CBS147322_8845 [Aspergillus niger]KAI2963885.1 hypothetical protein CBS147324_8776 [Aspergillus niger]KAI2980551.1 hypothetical protein CBS147482_10378 [Aspergillus niger]KAI2980832.1 hypothetical protein CBS147344_10063 [Aspergillus niger]